MKRKKYLNVLVLLFPFVVIFAMPAASQTPVFTYQGKLNDGSLPANGSYDMIFHLFDTAATGTGTEQATPYSNPGVVVTNGIFTAGIQFGTQPFAAGKDLYLQIDVRPAGSQGGYTTLAPRQPLTSAPYAVQSLNASTAANSAQLGGISSSQYVQTGDARLSDARNPLPGSASYIQNGSSAQASSNFNISGTGSAGAFNASTQYNIAGSRVLSISGANNAFLGASAGAANTGSNNSFFGSGSGSLNSSGQRNSFFGALAGNKNTTGVDNTFIGNNAGPNSSTGGSDTFLGSFAGQANSGGSNDTFLGASAGTSNIGSSSNTFVGAGAANSNLPGSGNTLLGANADLATLATNSTAIGQNAYAGQSNSLILGSISGTNGATVSTNVGIGTTTPLVRFQVVGDSAFIGKAGIGTASPSADLNIVNSTGQNDPLLVEGNANKVGLQLRSTFYGGAGRTFSIENQPTSATGFGILSFKDSAFNSTPMELHTGTTGNSVLFVDGIIGLELSTGGQTSVCTSNGTSGFLAACSSSLRYKKDLTAYTSGLTLLNHLKPIKFRWKSNDVEDLGFGAEDVAKVEPLLVTHNKNGEVEGVKYDRLTAVLVNAVKEQQLQIDRQNRQIIALTSRLSRIEKSGRNWRTLRRKRKNRR